jgi:WD40 repeat protein
VAFSADGSRLLSWAVNGPIRLWDPETGEDLACLDGHEGGTLSAAFLPDGTALSCGQDGVVRRWDLLAGRQEAEVCRSDRPFNCLSLAPDGRHFLTGGDDCLARLWSLGGEEVRRYAGHTDEVWAVVASPDGQRIVSGGKDGTLRWWDAASGLARSRLGGWFTGRPKGRTQTLCFLPDGTRLWAAGPDGPVEEYDPAPKLVRRLPAASSGTNGLALLADGRLLAACRDGSVRLWDAAGEVQLACWREHERGVWGVAVSPDGRTAASAGSEGHVCVWRVPPAPTSGRVSGDPGVGSGR